MIICKVCKTPDCFTCDYDPPIKIPTATAKKQIYLTQVGDGGQTQQIPLTPDFLASILWIGPKSLGLAKYAKSIQNVPFFAYMTVVGVEEMGVHKKICIKETFIELMATLLDATR